MTKAQPILAVVRALKILNAFQPHESSLSLQELSVRTELYKSTLLRQLNTLMQHNCITRLENGEYQLGTHVLQWANVYTSSFNLGQHIPPVLDELVQLTGEGASFFVRDGSMRICLYRSDSKKELRDHIQQGELLPLEKGAAGRVLLQYQDFQPSNNPPEVIISIGEREKEIAAIAAPIFNTDELKGAIAISGPATRFTKTNIAKWQEIVLREAKKLSRTLGGERFYL